MTGREARGRNGALYVQRPPLPVTSEELFQELGLFEAHDKEAFRAVRRPAGRDLSVEMETIPGREGEYEGLAPFWLAALWRFVEDSQQTTLAFEGIAFQALAEPLTLAQFAQEYGLVRSRLTLPPPYPVLLRTAYRVLNGRIVSFAGITEDLALWCGFFQADVFPELD